MTTLDQRLVQLDVQPVSSKDLFPRHKYLMIKRSQRCRKCEHNLSKPEYNPTSIKFKIQLAAYYHIPEVIIYKLAPASTFLPGSECNFVLKLSNPTQHPTNVEFLDLSEFQTLKFYATDPRKLMEMYEEIQIMLTLIFENLLEK